MIVLATLLMACSDNLDDLTVPVADSWWEALTPDVMIGTDAFYAKGCSITQVSVNEGLSSGKVIFKVPYRVLATCDKSNRGEGALWYDGEYIIFNVCHMSFGAGGCPGERYRSADFEHWEEEIGVTWIKGEQYEAWRVLGSKSSRHDSVKKIK